MKKASKAIAFAMASAMAVSMAACGGSASSTASGAASGDSASATGNGSYDQVTYAYATFNNIPTEEDLDVVEEEINKITREKIGAEITLKPISIADYVNKVSLSLQGGEKIDVYQSLGNFGNCVSTDMCYDISDLIDSCAPETKALLGDKFLDACKVNGKLYGIPTYKPFALTPMFIYRKDIADELGMDILKNLTLSEETALEMIRSDKESDRYYAKKSIYTAMHAALLQDNAVDLLIVAENSYGGYMESTNGDSSKWALPYETRKAVESFTWKLLGSGTRKNSWTIQEIAGEPFLYRAYMRNGHIVAAYISVRNFFSSNTEPAISNLCLALTDSNGYVWKTIGSELKNIPLGQTMQALGRNWKVNQLEIGDSSLYVTSYLNEYGITYTTQTSVLSVILIAIVALGCSAAIIFYTRRQIIKPMKDMTEKLHDMNGVTEGFQIQTSYGSQEFLVLRDTFNRMMRENVDLRLSAYKHHMEMQDSELRCIRLQLRPHFFLNAMTTISSLSMQGQNDSIKR